MMYKGCKNGMPSSHHIMDLPGEMMRRLNKKTRLRSQSKRMFRELLHARVYVISVRLLSPSFSLFVGGKKRRRRQRIAHVIDTSVHLLLTWLGWNGIASVRVYKAGKMFYQKTFCNCPASAPSLVYCYCCST